MLEISSVQAGYDRTTVLHGVTVSVPKDAVATVLGHNGAGKSTLLRVAMGLLKPKKGAVLLDGEDITRLAPHQRVARGMAYVPQGQQSFPHLTTAENLQLVADGRPDGKEATAEALDLFPVLRELSGRRGRPALRRAAAATRHRPRPDHPAEAAPARRTDRGHPAVRRRRDRGDDPRPHPARRPLGPPRGAARRLRHAGRAAVLRPGGGPGDVLGRGRHGRRADGTGRAQRVRPVAVTSEAESES